MILQSTGCRCLHGTLPGPGSADLIHSRPSQDGTDTCHKDAALPAAGEGGARYDRSNDIPLFSPSSDLSPCLPCSLFLKSLGSPGGELSASLLHTVGGLRAPLYTQNSHYQASASSVPLILTQHMQAAVSPAPLVLKSWQSSSPPLNDPLLWALLQKLPTREDFDSLASRVEAAL